MDVKHHVHFTLVDPVYVQLFLWPTRFIPNPKHFSVLRWRMYMGKGGNIPPPACRCGYHKSDLQRPHAHFLLCCLHSWSTSTQARLSKENFDPIQSRWAWATDRFSQSESVNRETPGRTPGVPRFTASDWLKRSVAQAHRDWLVGFLCDLGSV